jgi:hypothetical protein
MDKKQQFNFLLRFLQGNLQVSLNNYHCGCSVGEYMHPADADSGWKHIRIIEIWNRKTQYEASIYFDGKEVLVKECFSNDRFLINDSREFSFDASEEIPVYRIVQRIFSIERSGGKFSVFPFQNFLIWAASDNAKSTLVTLHNSLDGNTLSFCVSDREVAKTVYATDCKSEEILFDYLYDKDKRFSEFVEKNHWATA